MPLEAGRADVEELTHGELDSLTRCLPDPGCAGGDAGRGRDANSGVEGDVFKSRCQMSSRGNGATFKIVKRRYGAYTACLFGNSPLDTALIRP